MRSFAEHAPAAPRNDWQTLRSLIPYLWEHKPRVMLALVCLMLAKVATVTMPWFLKHIVDHLSAEDVALTLPLTLLLGYGAMRLATSGFGELRMPSSPG